MKKLCLVILYLLFLTSISVSQIVGFYPVADTVYIAGGCTLPIITVNVATSLNLIDSIKIVPGWNTGIWIKNINGGEEYFEKAFFLVKDSLNIFEYELCIDHHLDFWGENIFVPFDSVFTFDARFFDFKLFVKNGSFFIDSLRQSMRARIGIGVELKKDNKGWPLNFTLHQNYPNPFNQKTTLHYNLPKHTHVTLKIHNTSGQEINVLVDKIQNAGNHSVDWNGKTKLGQLVTSGIYLLEMRTGDFRQVKKMMMLR